MYLIIDQLDGHIEETNGNKYLVFGSTNEYKKVFKKYTEFWDGIKDEIETINGGKKGKYGIGFMKIKSIHMIISITTIVRSVFEEDGKFYPQLYLDDCLYEL